MLKRKSVYLTITVISLFITMFTSMVFTLTPVHADLEPSLIATSSSVVDQNDPLASTYDINVNLISETGNYTNNEPTDLILMLDKSISMAASNRMAAAQSAANLFVDKLIDTNPQVRISLITFNHDAYNPVRFSNDKNLLHNEINSLVADGYTRLEGAMISARAEFANYARPNSKRVLVLLTDGAPADVDNSNRTYANLLNAEPTLQSKIINFTGKADDEFLNGLVNINPERSDYYVASTSSISKILDDLANTVVTSLESVKVTATIPNYLEIVPNSLVNQNGLVFDMNAFANNQIVASYGKTTAHQDLSFSYKVRLKGTPLEISTWNHNYSYEFKDYQQNKIVTKSLATEVSTPFHKITTSKTGNGTISDSCFVAAGANFTVAITPSDGYEVSSLLVNGTETPLSGTGIYTMNNVSQDYTIAATFSKIFTGPFYEISADNIIMTVDEVKNLANQDELINLANAQARHINNINTGSVILESSDLAATIGNYTANFTVAEETGTKIGVKIKVVSKHVHQTSSQMDILGNNIILTLDEAKKITNNDSLRSLAKIEAFQKSDFNSVPTELSSTNFKAQVGDYTATFIASSDKNVKATTIIKVVAQESIGRSDDDAIIANGFTMTRGRVDTYTDENLIEWANAKGYNLKNQLNEEVVVSQVNIGKDLNSNDYYVEFALKKDPLIKVKVKVKIFSGATPELNVTTPIQINVNDSFSYTEGIDSLDEEDGNITAKIKVTGTVDTTKKGIYTVMYNVTDADYNTVSKLRVVVVGDYIVGSEYIYDIENYVILSDVVTATNNEILTKTKVQAWKVVDGTPVATSELEVRDNNGYSSIEKVYTPKIAVRSASQMNDVISAKAIVYDRDKQSNGNSYSIVANQLVLTIDEAKSIDDTAKFINLSQATAIKRSNLEAGILELVSTNFVAKEGTYNATFKVKEEANTVVTIAIKVLPKHIHNTSDKIDILGNNIILTLEEAKKITNYDTLQTLAKVESYKQSDLSNVPSKLINTTFKAAVGSYVANYEATDDSNAKLTTNIQVISQESLHSTVDDAIAANSFTITKGQVDNYKDEDLVAWANAQGFNLKTSTSNEVAVKDVHLGKDTESDAYYVIFVLRKDENINVKVKVTVSTGEIPELTVTTPIQISVNDTFSYTQGISAVDEEDGNLNSKIKVSGTVDTTKKGIYVVTYTVTDEDYNTVSKLRVVVVGDYIVGSDYIYDVENYVILSDVVKATNNEILEKTKVQAWKVVDGTSVASSEIEVLDNDKYSAVEKVYAPKIAVKNATQMNDVITAKVIVYDRDKQSDGATYSIVANQLVFSVDEVKALQNNQQLVTLAKAEAVQRKTANIKNLGQVSVAFATTTLEKSENVEVASSDLQASAGMYTVTFRAVEEQNTLLTIQVKVVERDVINHGAFEIYANDLAMTLDQAKKIQDINNLEELAKVEAVNRKNMQLDTVELVETDFKASVGTYNATFQDVTNPNVKITIQVHIVDTHHHIINEKIEVFANNLIYTEIEAKSIQVNEFITASKAIAFNRVDNSVYNLEVIETNFSDKVGTYEVKYLVEGMDNVTITVQVKVVSQTGIIKTADYAIVANPISLSVKEARTILDEQLIIHGAVEAYDLKKFTPMEVKLTNHSIEGKVGKYNSTFQILEIPSIKIDNPVEVVPRDLSIEAIDVTLTFEVARKITLDELVQKAQVSILGDSMNLEDFPKIKDVYVSENAIKQINEVSTSGNHFEVKFWVDLDGKQFSKTIQVNVDKKYEFVKPAIIPSGDNTQLNKLVSLLLLSVGYVILLFFQRKKHS